MTDIIFTDQLHLDAELENIAKRYKNAGRLGIQVLNLIGTRAEGLLCRLPKPISEQLNYVTWIALEQALLAATKSRKWLPDQSDWLNTVVGTTMGAVGGVGGLPSALVELPVTTTLMLRIIEGVAVEYGFDPMVKSVRLECLHVFSSAGPFEHDD
ncbi:MAG: EcsC family protein, partial [Tateyamaria sp.]|nr:EcsC family protein [Tateyamaria sp.]